ncbi:MAG TPA: TonB family protein [Brevundimonas sp.]|uniref:TonB family protein n=1 Tax=Brevundimonas sp. TaxID=1871086 RepID=UPI002DF66FFE|nr:TonB family protein [Brevundimonas sp.]
MLALLLLVPGAARAQSEDTRPPVAVIVPQSAGAPPPRPSMITNPAWGRQPRLEYPEPALDAGVEGSVTLRCTVSRTGYLVDCEVLEDVRPGFGFAEAALAGAATARVSPRTVDGLAEDAKATWTATFRLPEEPGPPAPPPGGGLYDANGGLLDVPPRWARRPVPVADDLPAALLRMRSPVHAGALVACRVRTDGRLEDCRAEAETPRGAGVGEAAVGVVRRGRLAMPIESGSAAGPFTVRSTITFHIP